MIFPKVRATYWVKTKTNGSVVILASHASGVLEDVNTGRRE